MYEVSLWYRLLSPTLAMPHNVVVELHDRLPKATNIRYTSRKTGLTMGEEENDKDVEMTRRLVIRFRPSIRLRILSKPTSGWRWLLSLVSDLQEITTLIRVRQYSRGCACYSNTNKNISISRPWSTRIHHQEWHHTATRTKMTTWLKENNLTAVIPFLGIFTHSFTSERRRCRRMKKGSEKIVILKGFRSSSSRLTLLYCSLVFFSW